MKVIHYYLESDTLSGFLDTVVIDVSQIVVVAVVDLVPVGIGGGIIHIGIDVEPAHNGVVGSRSFSYVHVVIHGVNDIPL